MKRLLFSSAAVVVLIICIVIVYGQVASPSVTEWKHGWKTENVIATRYWNNVFGHNIGFEFLNDPYNSDDARLSEFMEAHQGFVYQGGGYPGASLYVVFEDVKDRESANRKLKSILPELDRLVRSLRP